HRDLAVAWRRHRDAGRRPGRGGQARLRRAVRALPRRRRLRPAGPVDLPAGALTVSWAAMPIHLRAEMGDYAPAVLLPGDPLRARRIAEEFMEGSVQVNGERGLLGYSGTFQGRPVSVQATGMGCPTAAIVIEELIQL